MPLLLYSIYFLPSFLAPRAQFGCIPWWTEPTAPRTLDHHHVSLSIQTLGAYSCAVRTGTEQITATLALFAILCLTSYLRTAITMIDAIRSSLQKCFLLTLLLLIAGPIACIAHQLSQILALRPPSLSISVQAIKGRLYLGVNWRIGYMLCECRSWCLARRLRVPSYAWCCIFV